MGRDCRFYVMMFPFLGRAVTADKAQVSGGWSVDVIDTAELPEQDCEKAGRKQVIVGYRMVPSD